VSAALAGRGAGSRWFVVTFVAGVASVAGFGDWNLFPLPLLALGLLFFAWTRTSAPRAAAGLGLAFGAGIMPKSCRLT
jgi:apolipoprotein N-acyltransferase